MENRRRFRKFLSAGTRIGGDSLGAAIGASVGVLVAGPGGAILGGAAGSAFSQAIGALGHDITEQLLSPREEARVGYVLTLAISEVLERVEQGEELRSDGFFDSGQTARSSAEEVVDHILLRSRQEPEERKLPYMAHLIASIAFDSSIDVHMAHQITRAAEQLTYRQLCLLRLAEVKHKFNLRSQDYRKVSSFPVALYPVLFEIHHLHNFSYINMGGSAGLGVTDVRPSVMSPQGIGVQIHNLMKLSEISDEDLLPLANVLT